MASAQCEEQHVQLSCEENSSLDELIKCAEESYVSEDIENKARAVIVQNDGLGKGDGAALKLSALAGAMTNQTKGPLHVIAKKQWKGHTVKTFTDPLHKLGTFAQAAVFGGVEGSVVYGGKNKAGVECGWLLAWSDSKGRKAYAECGPRSKFDNIDWNQIRAKLNNSGSFISAKDSGTGTSMYAKIAGVSPGSAIGVYYSG